MSCYFRNAKIVLFLIFFSAAFSFATLARIESMGKNRSFLKDDISAFDNPAYILEFPNLLLGSLGQVDKNTLTGGITQSEQWFGGWIGLGIMKEHHIGLGIAINHSNDFLKEVFKGYSLSGTGNIQSLNFTPACTTKKIVLEPIAETDIFAVYNIEDFKFGFHVFMCDNYDSRDNEIFTRLVKTDIGAMYHINNKVSVEAAFGFGYLNTRYIWRLVPSQDTTYSFRDTTVYKEENPLSIFFYGRGFIQLPQKSKIIPLLKLKKVNGLDGYSANVSGCGVGIEKELHRGLVWTGVEYLFSKSTFKDYGTSISVLRKNELFSDNIQCSFGIEKQMIWEWFMLRVGATKTFAFEKLDKERNNKMETIQRTFNENSDVVGWGIALIPNQALQFDITASEEFPYTGVFNGSNNGIIVTRISATYKF
ncbi:MAG: hypothetical protein AB1633_12565 [Elusimicrobiota bacterium]